MKEVYILATAQAEPVAEAAVREAFESDEVELTFGEDGCLFSVRADDTRVDVRFDVRKEGLGWTPDLLTGTQEAHELLKTAKGFYRVAFEPGKPQGSVAVFEALWCIRSLLENVNGVVVDVTAFKIHTAEDVEEITELDFDIRDHITLHAVEAGTTTPTPMWVHSHGMSKFGLLDVEIFSLSEKDLQPAETFFHELCTDLAFGQGPVTRIPVATSVGMGFQLLPCDEARRNLFGVPPDTFDAHESHFLTVVSPEGRHSLSEVLSQYRDRFEEETPEEAEELLKHAKAMLPAFKARFGRKGLMDPLTFAIRAPFEVHPEGGKGAPPKADVEEEQLWVEVLQWEEGTLVGKLVDGGESTTEWRKGAHVEIEESQINAIALSREGRTLDEDEMKSLLLAERPM
jgi:hypothetical protein